MDERRKTSEKKKRIICVADERDRDTKGTRVSRTMKERKAERRRPRQGAKRRAATAEVERTEDSTREARDNENIRIKGTRDRKEGSLRSADGRWWLRRTVYTEAGRSGDLDSGVICEARCVVPLSRTSCHGLAKGGCRTIGRSTAR